MSVLPASASGTPASGAPSGDGRPLRRDAERNRRRILAAARELFAQRGLEVTLDDIAHHAGLGVGTVYRRFANREQLVEALFEEKLDRIAAVAEQAAGQADSRRALIDFLTTLAELMSDDRGLHEIVLSSAYGHDRIARARERIVPRLGRLVARAQADGALRADFDPTDVGLVQVMIGAVADYGRQVRPTLWRRYLTIVLDGLVSSRERPTPLDEPALDETDLDEAMRGWRPARR
jgi:AcrR family transcriptional regulator